MARVPDDVLHALRAFRKTGRKLFLVTGRQLDDLKSCMPELTLFDRVLAANGAVLYEPAAGGGAIWVRGRPGNSWRRYARGASRRSPRAM